MIRALGLGSNTLVRQRGLSKIEAKPTDDQLAGTYVEALH